MWVPSFIVLCLSIHQITTRSEREKRYLVFTESTQFGVFSTISIPLNSETLVSVAWFFEANYYNVANATYFEPLLGDIEVSKQARSAQTPKIPKDIITRKLLYTTIETMLNNHGFPGHACLLRAICENAETHFLHNGVLGDILHLILSPSTSLSEGEIEDSYYEAEFLGLEAQCEYYIEDCPRSPLEFISIQAHNIFY